MVQKLVITLDPENKEATATVIAALSHKGLQVIKTYPFGVLIAQGNVTDMAAIKNITGVQHIEIESTIQLPPGDAEIQ